MPGEDMALAIGSHTGLTMSSDWRVAIVTEGGITGRGLGSVVLWSGDAAASELDGISGIVAAATPERWRSAYVPSGNPHGYADQILYTLTLTRDRREYSTSWYDQSRPQLPPDLGALFDIVWHARLK